MVEYILDAVKDLCAQPPVIVIGNGADLVREKLGDKARFVLQEPQLGTADAVKYARETLKGKSDIVLVANSDFPLIKAETYRALVEKHIATGSVLTISTVVEENPRGFGRIVRDADGKICRIVEEKAASPEELKITELNSNPYCFQADWLWESLDKIQKSAVGRILPDRFWWKLLIAKANWWKPGKSKTSKSQSALIIASIWRKLRGLCSSASTKNGCWRVLP